MLRFKTSHLFLFLMLGLIGPVYSFAEAHYCRLRLAALKMTTLVWIIPHRLITGF